MNERDEKHGVCILTEGVAGAGKTTAAISNANDYLAEHPEKKDKVFLLTLTNTGAKEITVRTGMKIRGNTMHSFCWSLLKNQYALKNRSIPRIIDEPVSKKYMLDSIKAYSPNDDPETVCRCISEIRLFGRNEEEYDKDGNMVMTDGNPYGWMPKADYQAFMKRAQRIADHIDTVHPFPYAVCSGTSQWGEAAADFGGMTIALGIAEKINDFDYDRFFRAYAELWRKQTTLEWERYDIHDSHPLNHLRVNMTLQQFDEFLASYGVKGSDGMYPDTESRIRIW